MKRLDILSSGDNLVNLTICTTATTCFSFWISTDFLIFKYLIVTWPLCGRSIRLLFEAPYKHGWRLISDLLLLGVGRRRWPGLLSRCLNSTTSGLHHVFFTVAECVELVNIGEVAHVHDIARTVVPVLLIVSLLHLLVLKDVIWGWVLLCITFTIHNERGGCSLRCLDSKELLANQFKFFHAIENVFVEFWASSWAHSYNPIVQNCALFNSPGWHDRLRDGAVRNCPLAIDRVYRALVLTLSLLALLILLFDVSFRGIFSVLSTTITA